MSVEHVICLQCPFACEIEVVTDEAGEIQGVNNYKCKRGIAYAETEVKNPVRILTTTVLIEGGGIDRPLLPVQTEAPVSKKALFECIEVLGAVQVKVPVRYGQIIVEDILGSGVNVVSTSEVV